MTASAIQDITGISYAGSKVSGKKSDFDPADESVGSFQNAMNLAKENGKGNVTEQSGANKGAQSVSVQKTTGCEYQSNSAKESKEVKQADDAAKTEAAAKDTAKADAKDQKTEETAKTEDASVKDAVDEKAEELEKEVIKEVADALDVSEEEVVAAMDALGLTFMDLANQADMAALVTELTADGDSTALLTDETMFSDVVELTGQVTELIEAGAEELSEELSVDFSEIMDKMAEAAADKEPVADAADDQPVITDQPVIQEDAKAKVSYEIEDLGEPVQDVSNTSDETEKPMTVSAAQPEAAQTPKEQLGKSDSDDEHGMMNHTDAHPMFPVNEIDTAPAAEAVTEPEPYTQIDTQDIIDQIARNVRVTNGEDFSEVEMSLHPASLGNVHLQVTAREGVITAQIATENEAVRDALLVQAMVLKEELNGQGLKIEAVEVTVASHEFEQNMQGENGENAEQQYEEQVKKETRRRIMISGLEEAEEMLADENLTEAERIRIEMMAKSGSSMDMLA